MRIGQLAQRVGVTAKTLRFYEAAGLLPAPDRGPSGYRDYDEGSLDRLRFVRAAQAAGLSLAQIRDVIAARERVGPPCQHVAALLEQHAAELDRRLAELTALRQQVQRLRERAQTLDPAGCGDDKTCHLIPS